MNRLMFLIVMVSVSFSLSAHDGNDGWVTIQDYKLWSNTYGSDTIRVEVSDGYYNPDNSCPESEIDSYMVSSSLSVEAQQRIYSTLLSALMASRSVRLRLDTNTCEQNRPKILNVTIQ